MTKVAPNAYNEHEWTRHYYFEGKALSANATDTKTLNTLDFSQERFAVEALRNEGFTIVPDTVTVWRSADGIIDAVIKQRFRDGRFYIVLFA